MSKTSGAHRKCEVCGVREEKCIGKKLFARFPLNEAVCKQWVKVVGKEDLVYLPIEKLHGLRYVCGDHFKKRDFTKTKTRLKREAIPSVGLTMEPLSDGLFEEFPLHVYRSSQGSSVKKKAPITESDLLYGEELSDDDGLNQPATNAATADDTQPATPSVEIVDNETTTIIFPLTDDLHKLAGSTRDRTKYRRTRNGGLLPQTVVAHEEETASPEPTTASPEATTAPAA